MNTGIQDAHYLAWKIAALIKGIASSLVLRTYETECRPIAMFNTALSVQNFRAAMAVPAAPGLDPIVANSGAGAWASTSPPASAPADGVGSVLPSGLQRAILDGIFTIGHAQLSESLLNVKTPLGSSRLTKLRRLFEVEKSLQLQFPAEYLGFRYLEGALVPNSDSVGAPEPPTGRRRDCIPSADPGSRLPHMNMCALSNFSSENCSFKNYEPPVLVALPARACISTLDLLTEDKVEFLLIVAPLEKSNHLALAAFKVAEEFKVSAKVCIMWPADTVKGAEARSKTALAPWENHIDVAESKKSSNSFSWWSMCRMTGEGALLVRPDEHIAWCVKSGLDGDPILEMRRVFSAILKVYKKHA